ncbi:MAG: carboxypeptidase-like regulatory domain-containing protein [Planctomycetia bacterium]|nr:carboxypeptidase-like regulatory domain-containing protein [Planctomycetia bacterium]
MIKIKITMIFLCLSILLPIGCGGMPGGMKVVAGMVTLDGKPLNGVKVTFHPIDNGAEAAGKTSPVGDFILETDGHEGCRPGRYKITVNAAGVSEINKDLGIPKKYQNLETTDLIVTVAEDMDMLPVTLYQSDDQAPSGLQ